MYFLQCKKVILNLETINYIKPSPNGCDVYYGGHDLVEIDRQDTAKLNEMINKFNEAKLKEISE